MKLTVGIGRHPERVIKHQYIELLTAAMVLPYHETASKRQYPTVLGIGSVVCIQGTEVIEGDPPRSPATLDRSEIFVHWFGPTGIQDYGWLSKFTQYRLVKKNPKYTSEGIENVTAWDTIRRRAWKNDITALEWIEKYGAKYLPLLNGAIREFGGRSPKSDDADSISRRLVRLIRENTMARNKKQAVEEEEEEVMEEVEEQDEDQDEDDSEVESDDEDEEASDEDEEEEAPPAKKSKKGAKKGAKKEAKEKTPRAPAGQSVGATLVKLLKGDTKSLATKLSTGGTLTKKQLEKLRDGINEEAAAAREADKGSLASQLSSANRLVRRLARAAE